MAIKNKNSKYRIYEIFHITHLFIGGCCVVVAACCVVADMFRYVPIFHAIELVYFIHHYFLTSIEFRRSISYVPIFNYIFLKNFHYSSASIFIFNCFSEDYLYLRPDPRLINDSKRFNLTDGTVISNFTKNWSIIVFPLNLQLFFLNKCHVK